MQLLSSFSAGYSEDSDYTSDVNFPVSGQFPNAATSQYLQVSCTPSWQFLLRLYLKKCVLILAIFWYNIIYTFPFNNIVFLYIKQFSSNRINFGCWQSQPFFEFWQNCWKLFQILLTFSANSVNHSSDIEWNEWN